MCSGSGYKWVGENFPSVDWLEEATLHYSICYTAEYANDVSLVKEWMDLGVRLMQEKYELTQIRRYYGSRVHVNVLLVPDPRGGVSTGHTWYAGHFDWHGTGHNLVAAYIPYLTPSHPDWSENSTWGGLRLPPAGYHAKTLVHEFTHAIQSGLWSETSSEAQWVSEGLAEYEGMFNTTNYNRTEGFNSLVRRVFEQGDITCCETLSGEASISTSDVYFSGALIMKYLADTYGEDIHVRLVKLYRTFIDGLVHELTESGTTLSDMYQDLRTWLRRHYAAL